MKNLRYGSGAGLVWNIWEYRAESQAIIVTVVFGSAKPVRVEIPVCSEKRPRLGGASLTRLVDGWQLTSTTYCQDGFFRSVPLHPDISVEFYHLSGAPEHVDAALAELVV